MHFGFRPAFTLVELIASIAVIGIILLSVGSALTLSARVSGQGATDFANASGAADAVDQVADDLNVAKTFTERTSTSVTFVVPDRTGGGLAGNQVRYAWSGTAGDPLTRQYCAALSPALTSSSTSYPPVTLLADVKSLGFQYMTRSMGTTASVTEQTAASHDAVLLGAFANFNVSKTAWVSQSFTPALPLGTSSYSITRVRLMLKASGQDDVMKVQVVMPDSSSKPTGTVLDSAMVYAGAFSSAYEYVDVPFTNLTGLNPAQPLCVEVMYIYGGGTSVTLQYENAALNILSGATWGSSTDSGATWTTSTAKCARFVVMCTVP